MSNKKTFSINFVVLICFEIATFVAAAHALNLRKHNTDEYPFIEEMNLFLTKWTTETDLEGRLKQDIEDGHLDNFRPIETAFILSGVSQVDSLQKYVAWYDELVQTLNGFHLDPFDRVASASKVFSYLHNTWLLHYKEQATTILDIIKNRQFNCVAATILYNFICSDLGWQTEAFETPTHVYTIFSNFTENITVENTSVMGFDIMRNLHDYSKYLLQFYPQNKALQIGYDRIYAYENSKGRQISNIELLGLLSYNRAYFAMKQQDYATAYQYVLVAQKFNRDSRSNVNFEIDLYFQWGGFLYRSRRFDEAFEVYADGYYRYRDIKELAQNCTLSFFNVLRDTWANKDWSRTKSIIEEIEVLDLLISDTTIQLNSILYSWKDYFYRQRMIPLLFECLDVLIRLNPDDKSLPKMMQDVKNVHE